jgi:hypothetical protein
VAFQVLMVGALAGWHDAHHQERVGDGTARPLAVVVAGLVRSGVQICTSVGASEMGAARLRIRFASCGSNTER